MISARLLSLAFLVSTFAACGGSTSDATGQTSGSTGGSGNAAGAGGSSVAQAGSAATGGGMKGVGGDAGAASCEPPCTSQAGSGGSSSTGGSGAAGNGDGGAAGNGDSGAAGTGVGGTSASGGHAGQDCGPPMEAACRDAATCTKVDAFVCVNGSWECPPGDVPAAECICGGSAGASCPAGLYCSWGDMLCGDAPGASGVCAPIPDAGSCPKNLEPVCGCKTDTYYDNICLAHAAGEDAEPCKGGGGGSGGTGGSGGSAGSGGSGQTGGPCTPTSPCSTNMFCSYPDALCGTGAPGICEEIPGPCNPPFLGAFCTCSGAVETDICSVAGGDISQLGNCTAPPTTFACGDHFCAIGSEYCEVELSDVSGYANSYLCFPVPQPCFSENSLPTCDKCFASEPCGGACSEDASMNFTLTCPGG